MCNIYRSKRKSYRSDRIDLLRRASRESDVTLPKSRGKGGGRLVLAPPILNVRAGSDSRYRSSSNEEHPTAAWSILVEGLTMRYQEFFKLVRQMTHTEAHQLIADAVLSYAEEHRSFTPSDLVNAEACAVQLGIASMDRESFRKANADTFPDMANTFVNQLIQVGILEHDWVAGRYQHKLNPERKEALEMLTTLEGLATTEFVEALHDKSLRARCQAMVINTGAADTLVREAVTVLEDRLRAFVDAPVDRRNLPAKVLHPESGGMSIFSERARQEDFFYLVRGVLGFYGTPVHHGLQEDLPPETARRVVSLIDEILGMLSE